MLAHLSSVVPQERLARGFVALGPMQIRVDRDLRVDHDGRIVGEQHPHIGRQPSSVPISGGILFHEVAVRQHAGALEHGPQLHFAPTPALVRRLQRADERGRLLPEQLLRLRDRAEVARQRGPLLVGFAKMLAQPSERLAQRLDECADFFLSQVQIGLRAFLRLLEGRPGQLQKRFVVVTERVGRERRKAVPEAVPRLLEGRELVGGCPALGVELRLEVGRPAFRSCRP